MKEYFYVFKKSKIKNTHKLQLIESFDYQVDCYECGINVIGVMQFPKRTYLFNNQTLETRLIRLLVSS